MILRCKLAGGQVEEIDLDKKDVTIGRSPEADLTLLQGGISRIHCRLMRHGPEYILEDTGSTNGTYVNGKRVKRASLKAGDRITVGTQVMTVEPRAEKAGKGLVDEVHHTMRSGMGYKAIMAEILKEAKDARGRPGRR